MGIYQKYFQIHLHVKIRYVGQFLFLCRAIKYIENFKIILIVYYSLLIIFQSVI